MKMFAIEMEDFTARSLTSIGLSNDVNNFGIKTYSNATGKISPMDKAMFKYLWNQECDSL